MAAHRSCLVLFLDLLCLVLVNDIPSQQSFSSNNTSNPVALNYSEIFVSTQYKEARE
jgi:hypothetical protein